MYSVVLMAALTTSVDLPDLGGRRGGCSGCYGSCYGGGGRGGHGRRGVGGCCGCSGGGYGYGYGSCMGYGYGGCMGMGYGYGGCTGMGMGYGGCMGMGMGYGGCHGGFGYGGCTGMGYGGGCYGGFGYGGGVILQSGTGTGTGAEKIQKKPSEKGSKEESMLPAPATILVDLPADAKLFIDNEATTSTGSSRAFQSPVLNAEKEYHYTLKAEVIRDGKPVKAEKVVTVKAGEITPVTLTLPAAGVAQR